MRFCNALITGLITITLLSFPLNNVHSENSKKVDKEDFKHKIELKGIEYSRDSFLNEIKRGNEKIVDFFLKAGIDTNYADERGLTPILLVLMSDFCNEKTVRLLIKNGADININPGITPLILSVLKDNVSLDVTKMLIKNGADVNDKAKAYDNINALLGAAYSGNFQAVKLLLKNGAEINASDSHGKTPLIRAAALGHKEIVKHLIEKEADLNRRDDEDKTALAYSINERNIHTARLIVNSGARVDTAQINYDFANLLFDNEYYKQSAKYFKKSIHLGLKSRRERIAHSLIYLSYRFINEEEKASKYMNECKSLYSNFNPVSPVEVKLSLSDEETHDITNFLSSVRMGTDSFNNTYLKVFLNSEGKALLRQLTKNNIGNHMSIIVNKRVFSNPVIQERIDSGNLRITLPEDINVSNLYISIKYQSNV